MSKLRRLLIPTFVAFITIFVSSCAAGPDNKQNSLRPEGDNARTIMNLFSPIFWIATVIGVGVLAGTLYAAFKFRATDKNKSPKQIHGNSILEIGWTILPLVILIGIAIPTVKTIFDLDKKAAADAVQVEVVGKQWWWQFGIETDEYTVRNADGTEKLDADGKPIRASRVVTANELVIPVKREVQLEIKACNEDTPVIGKTPEDIKTANPCNVIHSFWVPSLGGKVDAVPGRTNHLVLNADKPGLYTGQCAEYCGLSHGVMRMQIRAVSEAEYAQWIKNLQGPPVVGSAVDDQSEFRAAQVAIEKFACTNCHSFDDPSEKTYGPNLTHYGPDFKDEVIAGGSIEKTLIKSTNWIHKATDWQNGFGIPMQADDCRLGPSPGAIVKGARCVGMPNFSLAYEYTNAEGQPVTLPAMTAQEAKAIAQYLHNNK